MENYDKNLRNEIMIRYCLGNLSVNDINSLKELYLYETTCDIKNPVCIYDFFEVLFTCGVFSGFKQDKIMDFAIFGGRKIYLIKIRSFEILLSIIIKHAIYNCGNIIADISDNIAKISLNYLVDEKSIYNVLLPSLNGFFLKNKTDNKMLFIIPITKENAEPVQLTVSEYLGNVFSIFNLFSKDY